MIDALNESTYPWERLAVHPDGQKWPIHVGFHDSGWIYGGPSGMTFRSGQPDLTRNAVPHELGHVLEGRLLGSDTRRVVWDLFCTHDPQHRWTGHEDTPWAYTVEEDFANAYAFLFHGERTPGAGHLLDAAEQAWLRDYLLGLEPEDVIWI